MSSRRRCSACPASTSTSSASSTTASGPIYVASQTTRKYHGNIRDLTADLAKFREAGEQHRLPVLESRARGTRERHPARVRDPGPPGPRRRRGAGRVGRALHPARSRFPARRLLPARGRTCASSSGQEVFDEAEVVGTRRHKARAAQRIPLRLPGPQARRLRRAHRPRHRPVPRAADTSTFRTARRSSCCSPTRTTPGCTSRWSASTSSRSTATSGARARRSTGWAARAGRGPRRASRNRCATWPASCSSSTPNASWSRASASPRTAPGSRSSRIRSSST